MARATFAVLALCWLAFSTCAFASDRHPSNEAGVALLGTRVLVSRGLLRDPDAPRVEAAMHAAYDRMRADEEDPSSALVLGPAPFSADTPDLLTYLPRGSGAESHGSTSPRAPPGARGDLAVIFLHGYGGRFALPCWQVARVAAQSEAMTACPDVGTDGAWWSSEGERIVRATVAALKMAGAKRIVLMGLSNGGIGATRLAVRMRGAFVGLVLFSGADPTMGAPGIPTLVLHGRRDAVVSQASSRVYAHAAHARFVDLPSGHFAMMLDATTVDPEVGRFLRATGP